MILEDLNGWVFRSLSNRLLRGPNMFSNTNLVCYRSCSQDPVFKIRERGSSFASMVISAKYFFQEEGKV